jgi:hypothetical protein
MTERSLVSITCRVLGVVCLVYAATWLPRIGSYFGVAAQQLSVGFDPYYAIALNVLFWILLVVAAVGLLQSGDRIARRLVPTDTTLLTTVADVRQWQRAVFALSVRVIGAVCVIRSLPQLALSVLQLAGRVRQAGWNWGTWVTSITFIGAIVLLILGAYFISGGKHIVEFAYGHPEDMPTVDDTNRDAPS